MKVEIVKNQDLRLLSNLEDNPRTITKEAFKKLRKSVSKDTNLLKVFEIVIDENNIILHGNQRVIALIDEEIFFLDVKRVTGATKKEKEKIIFLGNSHFGDWDGVILAEIWGHVNGKDYGENWGEVTELDLSDYYKDKNKDFDKEEDFELKYLKLPFTKEQMTLIENEITSIKLTDEYKYCETFGNENGDSNAVYLLFTKYLEFLKH